TAQIAVHPPVLGQLRSGTRDASLEVLQFGFEALQEGERVRGSAGKANQDPSIVELANLVGIALHYDITERHLSIAADRDPVLVPYRENGRGMKAGHAISSFGKVQTGTILIRDNRSDSSRALPNRVASKHNDREAASIPKLARC